MNRMFRFLRSNLLLLVAMTFTIIALAPTLRAESSANLDKHARKIEKRLAKYRAGAFVEVDLRGSGQAMGSLRDLSDATFQITDADNNKVETFGYADVARVRKIKEYIGAGSEPGHHFHHWVPVFIVAAVAAGGGIAAYETTR